MNNTTATELTPCEIKLLIKSGKTRIKMMTGVIESYENMTHTALADSWLQKHNWGTIEELRANHQTLADLVNKLSQF